MQIEVGQWKDDALENRYCRLCSSDLLDNEYHFLMYCDGLIAERTNMYLELHQKSEIGLYGKPEEVLKGMLAKENINVFARHLEVMWYKRRSMLYFETEEEDASD